MTNLEKYAIAVLDGKIIACDKIKREYERLLDKRRRAQDMIDKLNDPLERQVLELYFLSDDDMRMSEVADCVHYSERWTWSIYKTALYHLHQCTSVTIDDIL